MKMRVESREIKISGPVLCLGGSRKEIHKVVYSYESKARYVRVGVQY